MKCKEEIIIKGNPICRGIAIGKPFFISRDVYPVFERSISLSDAKDEIKRYRVALSHCKDGIKKLQKQLELEKAEEAILILEGQLEMLQDPLLTTEIEKEVLKNKKNIEFVFQQALLKYEERFKAIGDAFFAERFQDLQDLSRRIISHLDQNDSPEQRIPPYSIVCSQELTASDAASAHSSSVSAFLTQEGGATTHAAIVAKAKGIPFVTNADMSILKEHSQALIIVDGRNGKITIHPSQKTLRVALSLQKKMQSQVQALTLGTRWPAQTFDGYSIRLCANLDMTHEIELIHALGGQGVGLFRSEYIFLPHNKIPSEEEQFKIYETLVKGMKGLPVVIRTFDFGGDKKMEFQSFTNEKNPFLGFRSTRYMLKEKKMLKTQLRAILRASVSGSVSILFPMISTLWELREAKKMVQEAREELNLSHPVRIGCMIEVPSAALISDHFAQECDFLSIGTNDLVQYALAMDRNQPGLTEFSEATDPSVIRLMRLITSESNKAKIPVSVCGEIASDPRFTALLLGLGIQELSVAPRYLPMIKNAIRRTSLIEASELVERVLKMTTSQEILELLIQDYRKNVPDDLFYNHGQLVN